MPPIPQSGGRKYSGGYRAELVFEKLDRLKDTLKRKIRDVKSSHRIEAMARGLGYGSYHEMRASLKGQPQVKWVRDANFRSYLAALVYTHVPEGALEETVRMVFRPKVPPADETTSYPSPEEGVGLSNRR